METYSFSKLSTADECLYSYYAKYIAREKEEPNDWGLGGSHTHEYIERVIKGEFKGPEAAEKWLATLPNLQFRTMKPSYLGNYVEKSYRFLEKFNGVKNEVVSVEEHIVIELPRIKLQMYIDLLTKNDGIVITDWKSSKKFSKKDYEKKVHQLYIYAMGVKEKYGEWPKEMYFYFYLENDYLCEKFDEKKIDKTMKWIDSVLDTIEKGVFPAKDKPDFFCHNICGVKSCIYK